MPISAIGFAVGAAIGEAVNFALFTGSTNLLDLSLVFVVVGITISLMQSFAPRQKVVAAGWWIPATAISLAVVLAMDKHTFSENDWTVLGTFVGVIVGLITGPVLIRIASQEGPAILHEKA